MNFKKTTLPNGLRVITVPAKGNPSVIVMVLVETGSNYETKVQNGLSHFLEHMCFKGTSGRPNSMAIALELENIGAEHNAFTSHEVTGYYAKAEKRHFKKLLEVISDLYLNPVLPKADLEKERGVILQEISMYEDLPQRKVWDVLNSLLYGDTPAGRTILGPRENIKRFSRSDFVNYRNKHYVAGKTVVIVAGDVKANEVDKEVKKYLKNIPKDKIHGKEKVIEKQKAPAISVHKKKTDQTHLVIAFRSFASDDKRSGALSLLATILGRGMSSRLWQKMREELGACYYVGAGVNDYTDHGILTISIGIEARRIKEIIQTALAECKKLIKEEVSDKELKKAKEYCIGRMYLNLETTDDLADFYVDQVIESKKMKTPRELEEEIRKVTAKDIIRVAQDIFRNEKLNLAIVGNVSDEKGIKKVLTLK